ncbi:hypothetical protein Tco_0425785 [Tanacetum coccineum]
MLCLNQSLQTRDLPHKNQKVVQTVNVIAPRIFRTNPFKTSRVDNVVPNKHVKISVRIKPITVSQPIVIHKQQANFNSNGFSPTIVNNTAETRRPHPRSNSETDRVPSKFMSSCLLTIFHVRKPFELGTTRNTLRTTPEGGILLGPERPRTYEDLSDTEKKRYDANVRTTNIMLQGLPKDIYKLINYNIEAKVIWDNIKMLLAGSELTKEDRESQLFDEFERFKMLPGENINEYYVRFHKLVNNMKNIRMTMPNIQLNSKFVNNMSHELDWFVTAFQHNKVSERDKSQNQLRVTNQQAGPSNASILSEVHILENAIDHSVTNLDKHEIHNEVQQANVIDSTSVDMGNSNVIPYEQYLSSNR